MGERRSVSLTCKFHPRTCVDKCTVILGVGLRHKDPPAGPCSPGASFVCLWGPRSSHPKTPFTSALSLIPGFSHLPGRQPGRDTCRVAGRWGRPGRPRPHCRLGKGSGRGEKGRPGFIPVVSRVAFRKYLRGSQGGKPPGADLRYPEAARRDLGSLPAPRASRGSQLHSGLHPSPDRPLCSSESGSSEAPWGTVRRKDGSDNAPKAGPGLE